MGPFPGCRLHRAGPFPGQKWHVVRAMVYSCQVVRRQRVELSTGRAEWDEVVMNECVIFFGLEMEIYPEFMAKNGEHDDKT